MFQVAVTDRLANFKMPRLWILLAIASAANAGIICENKCECKDNVGDCMSQALDTLFNDTYWTETRQEKALTIVLLDHNEIKHLTPFPALPLIKLSLSHNMIETIDDNCFRDLINLTELDLSNNKLTRENLGPHIFKGRYSEDAYRPLRALTILRLSSNELHSLHPDLFEHLPNLLELYLNGNPLSVIDRNTVMSIVTPPYLKVLDLSYTGIQELPDHMLHTPAHLEVLNLAGNRFTRPPKDLVEALHLKTLTLDNNPFRVISTARPLPAMPNLISLKMSWMRNLTTIEAGGLGFQPKLEELVCHHNEQLAVINPEAFSTIPDGEEGRTYSPITKLDLSYNKLGYIESALLANWNKMESLDLQGNPWVCDCENQWLLSTLTPIIQSNHKEMMKNFTCAEPIEMLNEKIETLASKGYHMRCLDSFGNRPEKDGNILIGVLVITLLAVPLTLATVFIWRRFRHLVGRSQGPADYSRAFYSRADHTDEF